MPYVDVTIRLYAPSIAAHAVIIFLDNDRRHKIAFIPTRAHFSRVSVSDILSVRTSAIVGRIRLENNNNSTRARREINTLCTHTHSNVPRSSDRLVFLHGTRILRVFGVRRRLSFHT